MTKLKLHTPDLTEANIAKLAVLFPHCVTETTDTNGEPKRAIDFDLLKQELSSSMVEGTQERYQLNWVGKKRALQIANEPIKESLRPCRAESVDFDTTKNLYIEGNNLDALKLLQETYLNQVKMIYIDPPYNTGNDFIYRDKFNIEKNLHDFQSGFRNEEGEQLEDKDPFQRNSESNGRFHSNWLSMMYSRLRLARNLLKDDGVIFISIDDNEQANLKRLCDEVFGEDNFVAEFIWEKKYTTSNNIAGVSSVHEYIISFVKNSSYLQNAISRLEYTEEALNRYKNPDGDTRGNWMDVSYHGPKTPAERPNLSYAIIHPRTGKEVFPVEKSWAYEKSSYEKHLNENRLWWGKDFTYSEPRLKKFISEMEGGLIPRSLLSNKDVGGTSIGRDELRQIFGKQNGATFDNPKPTGLIKKLLNVSGLKGNDIILDFFSGSATTAHAVMQLNAEDGGNRKFIMVQLPERCDPKSEAYKAGYKTIADIGKERIRRAGQKIKTENALTAPNLDIGFRVLKIDSFNMNDVYYSPNQTHQQDLLNLVDNIRPDRSDEDLLFQVLLDWGVDLTLPIVEKTIDEKTVFTVADNEIVACFDRQGGITEDFIKQLTASQPKRVVFCDSGFANDSVKINVEQIFKTLSAHTEIKTI